jgi:hypothetical protein
MGGLHFEVVESIGRAECKLCHKPIEKGYKQIRVTGRQTNGSCHWGECPQ